VAGELTARSAPNRASSPTAPREHLTDDTGGTARVAHHLAVAEPKGEEGARGSRVVAIHVCPTVERHLMSEPAVQLDQSPKPVVSHVSVVAPIVARGLLATASRQAVRTLDIAQIAHLEERVRTLVDIGDHTEEEASVR
jgi:hypothetical protein